MDAEHPDQSGAPAAAPPPWPAPVPVQRTQETPAVAPTSGALAALPPGAPPPWPVPVTQPQESVAVAPTSGALVQTLRTTPPAPAAAAPAPAPRPEPGKFYMRPLPAPCVAFASPEGRRLFGSALASGGLEGFFPLIQQFQTQNEPAYGAPSGHLLPVDSPGRGGRRQ